MQGRWKVMAATLGGFVLLAGTLVLASAAEASDRPTGDAETRGGKSGPSGGRSWWKHRCPFLGVHEICGHGDTGLGP